MVMLIYFILVIYSNFVFKLNRSYIFSLTFYIVPLAIFSSLRSPNVDRDYKNYYYLWYVDIKEVSYYYLEGLSKLIFTFSKSYNIDFHIVLFVFSFLALSSKVISLRNMGLNLSIALTMYLSFFFFQHEMTQVRLSVALSLALLAFSLYLGDFRSKVLSFIFLFVGFLFHTSAILLILIFTLNQKKSTLIYFVLAFLMFALLSILGLDISLLILKLISSVPIFSKYLFYFQGQWGAQHINVLSLTNVSIYIMCCWSVYEIYRRDNITKIHLFSTKLVLIGLVLIPLLSSLPVAAFRISQIFLFFYPVIIASLYPLYSSVLYRVMFSLFVVIYGVGLCYAVVVSSKILNGYETIYEFSLY